MFVHGLGGSGKTTWGQFPELIKRDELIGRRVDVVLFEYPTSLVRFYFFKRSLKIQQLALALRTEINNKYLDRGEIILVCHSMGGVVALKYLLDEDAARNTVPVKGIALYAPPLFGANLARWGSLVSFGHLHLHQLKPGSDLLGQIQAHWPHMAERTGIKNIHVVGGQDNIIKKSTSPTPTIELLAGADHSSIVKPKSIEDGSFTILKNFIVRDFGKPEWGITRPPVLFDLYDPKYENYYQKRREDSFLIGSMQWKNVWVFGQSGQGKTAALMRALHQIGANYQFVSLGHYKGADSKDLLAALGNNLDEDSAKIKDDISWPDLTEAVVKRLERARACGRNWVLIEELPLFTQSEFQEFFSRLCALLILYATRNVGKPISLALSSVADPRLGIENVEHTSEILKVVRFGEWRRDDSQRLMSVIITNLKATLSSAESQRILETGKGSPRFLKLFFLNFLALRKLDANDNVFEEALLQTHQELSI